VIVSRNHGNPACHVCISSIPQTTLRRRRPRCGPRLDPRGRCVRGPAHGPRRRLHRADAVLRGGRVGHRRAAAGGWLRLVLPVEQVPRRAYDVPRLEVPLRRRLADRQKQLRCVRLRMPTANHLRNYECIEGRRVLQCYASPPAFDRDGVPDNGCETNAGTDDNCTGCGDECLDPTKPCVNRGDIFDYGCGCVGDQRFCEKPVLQCVDTKSDDRNCGACGNACDSRGDGGTPPPIPISDAAIATAAFQMQFEFRQLRRQRFERL